MNIDTSMTVPAVVKGRTPNQTVNLLDSKEQKGSTVKTTAWNYRGGQRIVCPSVIAIAGECMEEKARMIRMTWFSDATVLQEPAPD